MNSLSRYLRDAGITHFQRPSHISSHQISTLGGVCGLWRGESLHPLSATQPYPQLRHLYELYPISWHKFGPISLHAAIAEYCIPQKHQLWTAIQATSGFNIFQQKWIPKLRKVLYTAASLYSHPAGCSTARLGLSLPLSSHRRGYSTNISSETRTADIYFRDRTRSSPSHLQPQLRITTAPTNNCGCYKNYLSLLVTFRQQIP